MFGAHNCVTANVIYLKQSDIILDMTKKLQTWRSGWKTTHMVLQKGETSHLPEKANKPHAEIRQNGNNIRYIAKSRVNELFECRKKYFLQNKKDNDSCNCQFLNCRGFHLIFYFIKSMSFFYS